MNGACIIAKSLVDQGVEYAFGVVGIPIVEVAMAFQAYGIKFVAMRNEQSACYAAQAMGYITERPAVCLVVSGPGMLHSIGGMANAMVNFWPVVVIGGSCDQDQEGSGAFQEWSQVEAAKPFCKLTTRVTSLERIPFIIEKAVKTSFYGRPGSVYIDLPGNFVLQETTNPLNFPIKVPTPPLCIPNDEALIEAANLLKSAKKPLVIIGKGGAIRKANDFTRYLSDFIINHNLPFLPTPMGKGILPDDHSLCVGAARSLVLREADVILLLGARLNWMLHFGTMPRFGENVKIIQVDTTPEEFHTNIPTTCALMGDLKKTVRKLSSKLEKWSFDGKFSWMKQINENLAKNRNVVEKLTTQTEPLNYYSAYKPIQDLLPKNCFIINEGANTMDIGRTMLPNFFPKRRLDAGTFGTMGVGLGYAIAASLHCRQSEPETRVVCIQGDSAFGFSGMEIETAIRYRLPIIFIVFNNNGIYSGMDEQSWKALNGDPTLNIPPTCLSPNTRYDNMMEAFGGRGFLCRTQKEISQALGECLSEKGKECKVSLINILIDPTSQRKEQKYDWLTRTPAAKL